jgi:hypothetical protein
MTTVANGEAGEQNETWIEALGPHRIAMTVDPPTDEQYQAIKASVASIGLVNPEVTILEGQCLDGITRLRACRELGLTHLLRIREFDPATDGDPYEYVRAQNEHRRHLSDEQRSQIAKRAASLRDEGLTYDEIAQRLGVSQPTSRRLVRLGQTERSGDLSESAGEEPAEPATRVNKRGERRPTTYKPRKAKPKPSTPAPSTPAGEEPTGEPEEHDETVEEPTDNLIEEEVPVDRPLRRPPSEFNLQKEDMLQKFKNHVDHHLDPMFKYLGDYVVPPDRHPWIQDLRDELGSLLGEGD